MVSIKNLGSSVDPYIDGYIDHRKNIKIIGVDTAQEASIPKATIDEFNEKYIKESTEENQTSEEWTECID